MADGTTFSIDIDVSGTSAAQAAQGVAALADRLTAAGSASSAAAEAVRAGESAYRQAEAAATSAAKAVERIGLAAAAQQGKLAKALDAGDAAAVTRATTAIGALNTRQAEAQAKAASTAAAMTEQAAALDRLRGAATGAAAAETQLASSLGKASAEAANAAKKTEGIAKASATAAAGSGKMNEIGEGFAKMGGPLGALVPKVTGAAEGFQKLSASLGSAGPYAALAVVFAAMAAGVAALAVAAAGATLAVLRLGVTNADTARTARLLAEEAKGGAAGLAATAKIALSLDSQMKKLKENVGKAFSVGEAPLERFLEGLSKLGALFEENSVTANAIKVLFGSFFDPMLDGITKLIPRFVTMFIQFEIMVMKAMIAIKPWGSTILDVAKVVGVLALVVGVGLAVAIGVVVAGIALMAVGIGIAIALVTAIIAAFVYFAVVTYQAGASLIGGIGAAFEWLKGLSLSEIGGQLIDGLVSGLMSAGPKVLAAITGIAKGAIDAAKKALGIASPSRIFAEIGMNTAAGMTEGVDGGAADVQGSLESLVNPPDAGGAAGAAAASGGESKGSAGGMFAGATFTFSGVGGDAKAFAEQFREHLEALMSRAGGGSPGAA